jgi:hypothetical protein
MTGKNLGPAMLQLQHIRLKCLKLAVMSSDTEAELNLLGILGRAQTLFAYVLDGKVPVMATGDEDETLPGGDGI